MSMTVTILAVGRLKGAERELCERYLKRLTGLGGRLGIGRVDVVELAEARAQTSAQRQRQEADALLAKLPAQADLYALDETGREMDSAQFADFISTARDRGVAHLAFALGGPDGHGDALIERAAGRLSLSRMTMPHGLARAMFVEQLYRALTILDGHPYHRS